MHETLYLFNALFDESLIPYALSELIKKSDDSIPFQIPREKIFSIVKRECHDSLSEDECANIAQKPFLAGDLKKSIASTSSQFLLVSSGSIQVKFCEIINWRSFTEKNGEDIFSCESYADCCRGQSVSSPWIAWPFCLGTDEKWLNNCLAKGMSENHFHLNGSSPTFYLNWCSLHNASSFLGLFSKETNDAFKDHYNDRIYQIFKSDCYLAVVTRKYLFHLLAGTLGKETKNHYLRFLAQFAKVPSRLVSSLVSPDPLLFLDNPDIFGRTLGYRYDYAETLVPTAPPSVETGERALLFKFFFLYEEFDDFDRTVFYFYLLLKRFLSSFFFQNNDAYGFRNFTHFEKFSDLFLGHGAVQKSDLSFFAGRYLLQCHKLNAAELRIAPSSTPASLKKKIEMDISGIDRSAGGSSIVWPNAKKPPYAYFFTIHFIKTIDGHPSKAAMGMCSPRNSTCRANSMKSCDAIITLASSLRKDHYLIYGIDAANCEIGCRPEVFGSVYRKLRYCTYLNPLSNEPDKLGLRFTYHVAEDFLGIVDGLRSIFEAITFLNMKKGDRLGHCVALAVDPLNYYSLKNYEIYQKKQDLLDDCAFLYFQLKAAGELKPKFADELECYCLEKIQHLYGDFTLDSYYRSMLLRGDDPNLYRDYQNCGKPLLFGSFRMNETDESHAAALGDPFARKLCFLYQFSDEVRKKGNDFESFTIKSDYVSGVKKLQELMKDFLLSRGLSIETNPTSNYLIGPFNRYCEVPTLRLSFGRHGSMKEIPITINTDDQGIFRTSLPTEYAIILHQLTVENPLASGFQRVSKKKARAFIEDLRIKSNSLSFLNK